MGTNRYAYSNNDPINKFDPNGNHYDQAPDGVREDFHEDDYEAMLYYLNDPDVSGEDKLERFQEYYEHDRNKMFESEAVENEAYGVGGLVEAIQKMNGGAKRARPTAGITTGGVLRSSVPKGNARPAATPRSLSVAAVSEPQPYISATTRKMNATVSVQNGHATVSFQTRRVTSLNGSDITALRSELQASGVNSVVVNTGRIIEPTGRLSNILNTRAQQGRTWHGLTISPAGNPSNAFTPYGVLK